MSALGGLLAIIAVVIVYRHASGKATYNRFIVVLLCLVSIMLTVPVLAIGWHNNPRRLRGDSWKTVI